MSQLKQYASYNTWANGIISGYVLKSEIHLDHELISSFPSMRKTFYHLWDAQEIWLSRLNHDPVLTWPGKTFTGTINDAVDGVMLSSFELEKKANEFPAGEMIDYKNMEGRDFSNSVEEIIMHVVNHGTYHRGQLITLLRQCGFTDIGSTDYIRFTRK